MAHRALLAAPGLVLLFATLACTAAPVGTVGNGTCGATSFGGDCDAGTSGAWDAAKENITSLSACVARAKGCKMANYVSYSNVPGNADCSWYSQCDMSRLCEDCSKCGIGCPKYYPYQSEVLRAAPPAGSWSTLKDKALTCAGSEYRGDAGHFDDGAGCLAAAQKRGDVDYAVWRGDSTKDCYVCAITGRGDPSSWVYSSVAGAVSFVGDGAAPSAPPN